MTDFGLSMFPTDYAIQPMELAKEAEARGFESLFFPEHTHIPTSRRTPWPGGGDLPREYWHTHDPFVSLMAAAAVTEKLKVGTGILLVPERDPIVTAKPREPVHSTLALTTASTRCSRETSRRPWRTSTRW